MSEFSALRATACLSLTALAFVSSAIAAEYEINRPDDPMYSNCQYRFAVIYPGGVRPMMRDIAFLAANGATVPARQFYVERGADRFSVTVAVFPGGPVVDDQVVEGAAAPFRQKGEVRFQAREDYDPGFPGRQLNVFMPNNRQLRASVYMADHHLVITESEAAAGDFSALQFEQSITLTNAEGVDLDHPNAGAPRKFPCL